MFRKLIRPTFALLAIASIASRGLAVDYVQDVYPILETYCVGCHTEDEAQGGLAIDSFDGLMKGGESGLALTPGVASSSRLFLMASGAMEPVMPPDDAEGPNEDELEILAKWINEGAVGPEGDLPIKRKLRTPMIETAAGVAHPITAVARSADGSRVATAQFESITIKDADGKTLQSIKGELGKVNSIQFDNSGEHILVASGLTGGYGLAAIYSVADGTLIQEFVGHRDVLYSAIYSPDQSRIATAGYDRGIVLWDVKTGQAVSELNGHNGAIFDLAFSPDGRHLVSACADETVKVWDIETARRLDTLSQPEGEVNAVSFTRDGKFILAASSDNRLRVWKFVSRDQPRINPLRVTRFVDESPLMAFAITPDSRGMVVISELGNVKVLRTDDWSTVAALEPLADQATGLFVSADGTEVSVALMNGEMVRRSLPELASRRTPVTDQPLDQVFLDVGPLATKKESDLSFVDGVAEVPRGVQIDGMIDGLGQSDWYRFRARRGEMWAIDADRTTGTLDPLVVVTHPDRSPVIRTRLQAVRDTYFTFRGKDSNQTNDFRIFNWQEIGLNQFLYANGEVTRTWLHPRGPDSGFEMYPGRGKRQTYFGTTHTTHALGEPAYIVRELKPGEAPEANGLPVIEIPFENDDDPTRLAGQSSRLIFQAPEDGEYLVRISDNRGLGADDDGYQLKIRPAVPRFRAKLDKVNTTMRPGAGREVVCVVEPVDGFHGPVTFTIDSLPEGWHSTFPVTVQAGQRSAVGTVWVDANIEKWQDPVSLSLTASAMIQGIHVERSAGMIKDIKCGDPPSAYPTIHPIDRELAEGESWTLEVQRGETVSARVLLRRKEGFEGQVPLGKEKSGRNAVHGVYVDNIGLNGLLVRKGETEREFFVTADVIAEPGPRTFFLTGSVDGGVSSPPITVLVK